MRIRFYNERNGEAADREVATVNVIQDHLWSHEPYGPKLIAVFIQKDIKPSPDTDGWYLVGLEFEGQELPIYTDWWVIA